jgi:hypothetical protein
VADAGAYSVVITNAAGSTNSEAAILTVIAPLEFTSAVLLGSDLVLGGTGGSEGGEYYLLAAADAGEGMTHWLRVATNTFGPGGSFSATNVLDPGQPQQFFRIELPWVSGSQGSRGRSPSLDGGVRRQGCRCSRGGRRRAWSERPAGRNLLW